MKHKLGIKSYILIILSGIISSLPFNIEPLFFLSWIGLIPLLYVLLTEEFTFKRGFLLGLIFGLSYYIPIYHWFTYMYGIDGLDVSKPSLILVIILAWIGISLYQGFVTGLIIPISKLFRFHKRLFPLLFAATWIIIEFLLGLGNFSFPWGRLYLTQYKHLSLIQSSSLFGALFVSFLIVLVNVYLTKFLICIVKRDKNKIRLIFSFAIAVLVFAGNSLFGLIHQNHLSDAPKNKVKVSLTQAFIGSDEAWYDADLYYQRYIELSKKALLSKPDIIIWPETAVPATLSSSDVYLDLYKKFCIENHVSLIVGGLVEENGNTYNALISIDKSGKVSKPYYKRRLVPFGEYVPLNSFLSGIMKKAGLGDFADSLTPGVSSEVINNNLLKIAPLICFDSVDGDLTRQSVKDGGEIITLITNDSWFENSRAVYQHNAHAVFRAVENERYVLRSANAGVSSFIDPSGKIVQSLAPTQNDVITQSVYSYDTKTLYYFVGDAFVYVCCLFVFAFLIYDLIKSIRLKQKL